MSKAKAKSKSAKVISLLSCNNGASLDEIGETTNWKPHSIRAFLSGLRKKGYAIVREQGREVEPVYRITSRRCDTPEKI